LEEDSDFAPTPHPQESEADEPGIKEKVRSKGRRGRGEMKKQRI